MENIMISIMTKHQDYNSVFEVIQKKKKEEIKKIEFYRYLKKVDSYLNKEEFQKLYRVLVPSRADYIRRFELGSYLKKFTTPIFKKWLGSMLTSSETQKIGLGVYLKNNHMIKKKKYVDPIDLERAFSEFKKFEGEQLKFMLNALEIKKNVQNLYDWSNVKQVLSSFMERYQLRTKSKLLSFFSISEKNLAGSESAAMYLLSTLRTQFKILNLKKARALFDKFDIDGSRSISYSEFDRLILEKLPHSDEDTIHEAYKIMNGTGRGKELTRIEFEEILLNKVELENKDDLLFEVTSNYSDIFKQIKAHLSKLNKASGDIFS